MVDKVRWLKIAVTLTVVVSLAIVLLVPSSLSVAETGELLWSDYDLSSVPPSVMADATELAVELYGDYQEKSQDFARQLQTLYLAARDSDFVIFFNPGGWGWSSLADSSQWQSIVTGIQSELDKLGYSSLLLSYLRTERTLGGCSEEVLSMLNPDSPKARDLASRAEFLTRHIPDLRVIITGESNGTVISDSAMAILEDNRLVYSIQTGPPFWYENSALDRTLVLESNGLVPDAFSQGDIFAMISASLENLFGFPRPEEDCGNILFYVNAPGHEYWWQYPEVSSRITSFLEENFGL